MDKYIRCDCCKGRKTMTGLGGISKDCSECDGIGYVEQRRSDISDGNDVIDTNSRGNVEPIKRVRGRPKRINSKL